MQSARKKVWYHHFLYKLKGQTAAIIKFAESSMHLNLKPNDKNGKRHFSCSNAHSMAIRYGVVFVIEINLK